ncbi:hypothetical protein [Citrobacter freundii]|uniref:hypothetical protein n=1 Tax=Citrobacter freundii TaxID=546 RepID=UPI0023AE7376|nr:hypothetical protein [Citrobacter freundii]
MSLSSVVWKASRRAGLPDGLRFFLGDLVGQFGRALQRRFEVHGVVGDHVPTVVAVDGV